MEIFTPLAQQIICCLHFLLYITAQLSHCLCHTPLHTCVHIITLTLAQHTFKHTHTQYIYPVNNTIVYSAHHNNLLMSACLFFFFSFIFLLQSHIFLFMFFDDSFFSNYACFISLEDIFKNQVFWHYITGINLRCHKLNTH